MHDAGPQVPRLQLRYLPAAGRKAPVVGENEEGADAQVISDANEATLTFHIQMQRLACQGTTGELVLLNRYGNDRRLCESSVLRLRIS